jgi:hypothetical protein
MLQLPTRCQGKMKASCLQIQNGSLGQGVDIFPLLFALNCKLIKILLTWFTFHVKTCVFIYVVREPHLDYHEKCVLDNPRCSPCHKEVRRSARWRDVWIDGTGSASKSYPELSRDHWFKKLMQNVWTCLLLHLTPREVTKVTPVTSIPSHSDNFNDCLYGTRSHYMRVCIQYAYSSLKFKMLRHILYMCVAICLILQHEQREECIGIRRLHNAIWYP